MRWRGRYSQQGWGRWGEDRALGLVGTSRCHPAGAECGHPAQVLQRALLDATANTAAVVQEAVSSIETVRSFAGEEEEERRHDRAVAEMLRLKNQIDTEKALFLLIQRVRRAGDGPWRPGAPAPPQRADPVPAGAAAGGAGAAALPWAPAAP